MTKQKVDALLSKLGESIKSIRTSKKMSQQNLAIACDIDLSTFLNIEEGKMDVPFMTLYQIAKCLDVPIKQITG